MHWEYSFWGIRGLTGEIKKEIGTVLIAPRKVNILEDFPGNRLFILGNFGWRI